MNKNHYIMLDNGAAEGKLCTDEDLMYCAGRIQANEIVLPDILGDMLATQRVVQDFLACNRIPEGLKVAGVLQGQTWAELTSIVHFYKNLGIVQTLCIPRHILSSVSPADDWARISLAVYTHTIAPELEIHCLGYGTYVDEVRLLAKLFYVRSLDTAFPVKQGLAGKYLAEGYTPEPHTDEWFTQKAELTGFIEANCNTFLEWANGA